MYIFYTAFSFIHFRSLFHYLDPIISSHVGVQQSRQNLTHDQVSRLITYARLQISI